MTLLTAKILIDRERTIAPISPLLFGGFVEHMGRCVYEGISTKASTTRARHTPTSAVSARTSWARSKIRATGLHHRPLPRRQFPERLQLARRRRAKEPAPATS